ncbi:chemotaxis protein CheW [Candidatus Deferrimicrobium sp.]|uniref:chemotaxis protein CheW n=1 Tax=Candidatus Deferrimicrobium sp. TaxID=3060586 RepID=UPI003C539ABE
MVSTSGISPLDETRGELLREASIEAEASGRVKTREESGPARSLLVFYLGSEGFAVDLVHVRKVMRPSRIARVSGAAPEVLGLMNCQGEVLCVLDLRRILSQGKETDPPVATEGKFIVVVQHGGKEAGFLVDAVRDVAELPASSVRPVLDSIDPSRARLFEGTVACGGRFVGLLSPSACLNP